MTQLSALASTLDAAKIVDIDLTSEDLRQGMLRGIAQQWASREPFYLLNRGSVEVMVTRYKDVMEVLQDRERFTSTLPPTPGTEHLDFFNGAQHLGRMDGLAHDQIRKVMNPAFAPAALLRVEPDINAIFQEKFDAIDAMGGRFDAMHDLCGDLITRVLLGVMLKMNAQQQAAMIRLHSAMTLIMQTPPGGRHPPEFYEAHQAARNVIYEMIAHRRETPTDDFIGRLVTDCDASGVVADDETIFANTMAIAAAGLGSTATSLAVAMLSLARHSGQYRTLRERRELLPQAIEECLRVHGPGFVTFPRFALIDTHVGGTFIPQGAMLYVGQQAASFDPEVYPDPQRFDIMRKPQGIPVFGAGPHHCIGSRLARLIMKVGLEELLRRYATLRLAEPSFEPVYKGMFGELMPERLPMVVER